MSRRVFNIVIIPLLSMTVLPPVYANTEIVINDAYLTELAASCVSYDTALRRSSLASLKDERLTKEALRDVVEKIIENLSLNEPITDMQNQVDRRRQVIGPAIEMDIANVFCELDIQKAKVFVLERASRNYGGFPINLSTMYIKGLPVSSHLTARKIVESKLFSYQDVMQYLLDPGKVTFVENDDEVYVYVLLEKLRKNDVPWKEGKKMVAGELRSECNRLQALEGAANQRLYQSKLATFEEMIEICNDSNLDEASCRDTSAIQSAINAAIKK